MRKDFIKDLVNLFFVFAKIGTFTIGGGMAMMPMMTRELIQERHWITEDELIDYYAVGQSTPGIIAVNVATFVGYKRCGIIGGIIATLGMITPSLIIIMVLAGLISSISDYPYVQKALKGVNVAVAALITQVIFNFSKKTIKNLVSFISMAVAFVCVYFFKVPSYIIILTAIFIGVLIAFIKSRKSKSDTQKTE